MKNQTKQYKVVFFNRQEEIEIIKTRYPHIVPYVPLSITVVEKKDHVAINAVRPEKLFGVFKSPAPTHYFAKWEKELKAIFDEFRDCKI